MIALSLAEPSTVAADNFAVPSEIDLTGVVHDYVSRFIRSSKPVSQSPSSRSLLAGFGSRLQYGFTSWGAQPRYILDPFCDVHAAGLRLQSTVELLERDFGLSIQTSHLRELQGSQTPDSRYGAWLGLRQGSSYEDVEAKIYSEVSGRKLLQDLPDDFREMCAGVPVGARWVMHAHTFKKPSYEVYFMSDRCTPDHFAGILSSVARRGDVSLLNSAMQGLIGGQLRDRLPGGMIGLSYAFDLQPSFSQQRQVNAVTLYFYCRAIWGRDRRSRQQFTRLMETNGVDSSHYQRITRASSANKSALTQHGTLGVIIPRVGDIQYSVDFCLEKPPVGQEA